MPRIKNWKKQAALRARERLLSGYVIGTKKSALEKKAHPVSMFESIPTDLPRSRSEARRASLPAEGSQPVNEGEQDQVSALAKEPHPVNFQSSGPVSVQASCSFSSQSSRPASPQSSNLASPQSSCLVSMLSSRSVSMQSSRLASESQGQELSYSLCRTRVEECICGISRSHLYHCYIDCNTANCDSDRLQQPPCLVPWSLKVNTPT